MNLERFRVLLIEDNPGDVRLLREELAETTSARFEIIDVSRISDAVHALATARYDLVLLDLNLPDGCGPRTVERIRALAPTLPVVVLTGMDDDALGVRALQAGAEDYLVKGWAFSGGSQDWRRAFQSGSYDYLVKGQVDKNHLARTLLFAIQRRRAKETEPVPTVSMRIKAPGNRTRVLGFLGAKGGVGTSIVALNVAAVLARQGRSVVAVELQPHFGTCAAYLNYRAKDCLADLIDLPPERIDAAVVRSRLVKLPSGVQAIFASRPPASGRELTPAHVDAILAALAGTAEVIVLDLAGHPSSLARTAISHCDALSVVTGPDRASIGAAGHYADLLRAWGAKNEVGFVVVNAQGSVDYQALVELESRCGHGVHACIPPAAELLRNCAKSGTPLVIANPRCPASGALADLAGRLVAPPQVAVSA